jgi:hypothetical protein
MKVITLFLFVSLFCFSCQPKKDSSKKQNTGQHTDSISINGAPATPNPYSTIDISPMDMSYFPVDYPKLKMAKQVFTAPFARIIYSRPHLQGRHIFHEVLKYGVPWRLGANESSELDLYKQVTIQGKKIDAGRYVIYCIPEPDQWKIILNSNLDSWGLQPDSSKDVANFIIPVTKINGTLEYFTMVFEKTNSGADMLMAWDDVEARLPMSF